MSKHNSLKRQGGATGKRSVMKRFERVKLMNTEVLHFFGYAKLPDKENMTGIIDFDADSVNSKDYYGFEKHNLETISTQLKNLGHKYYNNFEPEMKMDKVEFTFYGKPNVSDAKKRLFNE